MRLSLLHLRAKHYASLNVYFIYPKSAVYLKTKYFILQGQ